jgi:hypothetical protein
MEDLQVTVPQEAERRAGSPEVLLLVSGVWASALEDRAILLLVKL